MKSEVCPVSRCSARNSSKSSANPILGKDRHYWNDPVPVRGTSRQPMRRSGAAMATERIYPAI
jgi:hypothetical protein